MECQRIRVLLDLSELKNRPHKYVWMLVSTSDLKSIADFKDAVIKKLSLKESIKLFINGGLLLEEENILVLRDNDSVQIQYENVSVELIREESDARLKKELSNDNLSKVVEGSKKKNRLYGVVNESPKSFKEEYSHKRKRKRDAFPTDSSENYDSINLSQEESAMTFCDINGKSICYEKKQKKFCSASTSKEVSIEKKQYNGKAEEKTSARCDIKADDTYDSKKKKHTQYSSSSMAKSATIEIEEDNDRNVIYVESALEVSDNKSAFKEKKKKSFNNTASNDAFIPNEHCDNNEEISIIPVEISLDDSSQEINNMEVINNDQSNTTAETFIQSNNCKKKKRRRHRKRKIEHNLVSPFMLENIFDVPQPVKDSPTLNSCDNYSDIRKHIRFTSPKPDSKKKAEVVDLETCNQKSGSKIALDTSPNKSHVFPDAITLSSINKMGSYNTTIVANGNSSDMNLASSHKSFDLNSSTVSPSKTNYLDELSLKNPVLTSKEFEPTRNLAMHSFEVYPPLNTLPSIGTCIAFKLLELNASYSPEVSSYKEGVIKSINPKTEEIEIELTREEIKPGRIGKFENLKEGEFPDYEVTNKVKSSWSCLIEPRLVSRQ